MTPARSRLPGGQLITFKRALSLSIAAVLVGCAATLECGAWNFNGAISGNSLPLSSAFTFNPATCGKSCSADIDAMIQMVRVYDATDQMFLAGDGESTEWADANGWMIDQQPLLGWAEGYYGLNNDGTTFDPVYNTVGSSGTPNTLYDDPGGWGPNTYFDAVDVAVCFKSDNCQNRILGYYFWSFFDDSSGVAHEFITAPAWQDLNN
jgi:hypothetical protein